MVFETIVSHLLWLLALEQTTFPYQHLPLVFGSQMVAAELAFGNMMTLDHTSPGLPTAGIPLHERKTNAYVFKPLLFCLFV